MGNVAADMRRQSRTLKRSMTDLTGPIRNVNRAMNRGLRIAGTAALAAVAGGAVLATREFIRFDNALTQAGAKFVDLDTTAADYQDRLNELGAAARAIGSDTEFAATDAAGALDKMAMAGMSSQLSMALLRGTTDLATAAGADLTSAVDIATDSMGAFGLATDNAAQAERNLQRVSDVMVRTTTAANTSFEDLFEAVRAGAASFTAAGQEIETFNTFVASMANAGVKGSMAGTMLRNMATRLASPTGEAAAIIENLGIQTQDADGNFRDMVDILADFENGLKGMGTAQRTAALSTVFGQRAVTGINILLQDGTENLREFRQGLEDSGGAATTMAEAMRKSLGNRIEVLKSSLTELGFRFIEAFEEKGRGGLDKLIEGIQNFDPQPVIDFLVAAVEWGGKAFRVLSNLWPVLLGLAASVKVLAFATGTLGIALGLTPIGWIIAGITGIVTVTILLIRHWDTIKEVAANVWTGIVNHVKGVWDFFKEFFVWLGDVFAPIGDAIRDRFVQAFENIRAVAQAMWEFVSPIVNAVTGAVETVGDFLNRGNDRESRTMEEGRRQNAERYGMSYAAPTTGIAESRQYRETTTRSEVYVRPDRGSQLSLTPGGAPEPELAVGVQ